MKLLRNTAILVGLAAYGLFFYITLLPSLSSRTETWRRGELVYAWPCNGCGVERLAVCELVRRTAAIQSGRSGGDIAGGRVDSRLGCGSGLAAALAVVASPGD